MSYAAGVVHGARDMTDCPVCDPFKGVAIWILKSYEYAMHAYIVILEAIFVDKTA